MNDLKDGCEMSGTQKLITFNCETHNIRAWSEILKVSATTVSRRFRRTGALDKPLEGANGTLCWDCIHSVPNYRGNPNIGCEWSWHGKPVDGWKAVPTVLESKSWNRKTRNTYSFKVIDCPKFRKG